MKKNYFLGIDNGGSSIKCVVFDQYGSSISQESIKVPLHHTSGGFTERDPAALWEANCLIIRRALLRAALNPVDISGISLSGYGGGLILLDAKANPMYPIIVSTDSRADLLLEKFQKNGTDQKIYDRTLQHLWSGQQAMLLTWMKLHRPDVLEKATHILSIKDYLRYKLTGEFATEPTDASNTNLFNLYSKSFDSEIFRILGLEGYNFALPKLLKPCSLAGKVTEKAAIQTGLLEGTPVAAGLYDVASCTLASGIMNEDTLSLIVGTWSISGHLTKNIKECEGRNNGMAAFLDGWYFSEESSPTSTSNLDWFTDRFYQYLKPAPDVNVYEYCNQLASGISPDENDLIFIPYLYGSNTVAGARGGFFNLSGYHTQGHILEAIYEGILFSLLTHVNTLYGQSYPQKARFSGGASRSPFWCQMLSDILGIPVEVTDCEELGALGAAICAAVSTNTYADFSEATKNMSHISRTYLPDHVRHVIYAKKYQKYQKAIKALEYFYGE